ncbi:MAG: hypothetical protein GF383_07305 [Candidatus Lokiarchaeota archaeon]|nr:hypothetical protein [Candidatus Lokiarchaeota archaeon]MBD3339975.1 hypothetical protein [Candidatus Lokiarchaeota archaeon]
MADYHSKSFFGQKIGIILNSPSMKKPYIFITCVKRKEDGEWEKPSSGEGKTVKLSIEEIICISEILKRNGANWRGYHIFKEEKTEIFVGWEDDSRKVLIIIVGDYKKKIKFPNTKLLSLLIEHILEEKIKFATSGQQYKAKDKILDSTEQEYSLFSEQITAKNGLPVVETTEYDVDKEPIKIHAKINMEAKKALLISIDAHKEFWIPKSTIQNFETINIKDNLNEQIFIVDRWIIEKNILRPFD